MIQYKLKGLDDISPWGKQQYEKKDLAYRMYPLPEGTSYRYADLIHKEIVETLFDYCQIMEAIIYKDGWKMLLNYHGLETLYEINEKSGWFDCNSLEEFLCYIESNISDTTGCDTRVL